MDPEDSSTNMASETACAISDTNGQRCDTDDDKQMTLSCKKNIAEVGEPNQKGEAEEKEDIEPDSPVDKDLAVSRKESSTKDGFLFPVSLPPAPKPSKRMDVKQMPVSMTIKSKFSIPADIYKAPKAAAFMAEMTTRRKKESSQEEELKQKVLDDIAELKTDKHKPKPPPAKLTYEPPVWTSIPEDKKYSLEVLKMGSIMDKVELSGKEYFLVGRLPDCDIKMEHPSISRYHAVLQYGSPGPDADNVELQKDSSFGFYIYDLGSTHGTIINKQNIRSKTFYRIKVGHVVKFGGSTRMFILEGPADDQEEEAKETATELRQYNKKKIEKKKDLEKMMLGEDSSSDEEDREGKKKNQKSLESSGVTWGMLEDAVESSSDEDEPEEEEPGDTRADHPDAVLVQTKKDPFYVKDPMKALKNLYEREKMELDFECNERRSGHWHVRLSLPVDGPSGKPVYAEVNATGKKKDTMRQCALEACRVLERHGLFHHKDHQKQRAKQWEKDDFYDSDEDEFHDRTGELDRKRKLRMQRIGKKSKSNQVVETYESLAKKVQDLDSEIKDIETKLQKDKEATKVNSDVIDPLDAFMQQVKSGKALDTTTRAKLKRRIFDARKEHLRLSKLAELARPSSLPPLVSSSLKTYSFIGKMKGKKKVTANVQSSLNIESVGNLPNRRDSVEVEEEEEEEEGSGTKAPVAPQRAKIVKLMEIEQNPEKTSDLESRTEKMSDFKTANADHKESEGSDNCGADDGQKSDAKDAGENFKNLKASKVQPSAVNSPPPLRRVWGPTMPPEFREQTHALEEQECDQEQENEGVTEPKKKRRRQRKPRQTNDSPTAHYSNDPKYSVWLPPENQSGDGKTSLNEKLGY